MNTRWFGWLFRQAAKIAVFTAAEYGVQALIHVAVKSNDRKYQEAQAAKKKRRKSKKTRRPVKRKK